MLTIHYFGYLVVPTKDIPDGILLNQKSRLCDHGEINKWGIDHWETYATLVNWISVKTLLVITKIHNDRSQFIGFVLSSPQADLDVNVYMDLSIVIDVPNGDKRVYVLKLKNISMD